MEKTKTCLTCRYWEAVRSYRDGKWGKCALSRWPDEHNDLSGCVARSENADSTLNRGAAHLATREDFGCNQWQAKPANDNREKLLWFKAQCEAMAEFLARLAED